MIETLGLDSMVWKGKWKGRDQMWKEGGRCKRIGETGCKFIPGCRCG